MPLTTISLSMLYLSVGKLAKIVCLALDSDKRATHLQSLSRNNNCLLIICLYVYNAQIKIETCVSSGHFTQGSNMDVDMTGDSRASMLINWLLGSSKKKFTKQVWHVYKVSAIDRRLKKTKKD